MASYLPLLLAKQGEREAVRVMSERVRAAVRPMFVVPPRRLEWKGKIGDPPEYARTLGDHLVKVARGVVNAWGPASAFCDTLFVDADEDAGEARAAPICQMVDRAGLAGTMLIPTTGPDRSSAARDAVRSVAALDRRGACLRLPLESVVRLVYSDAAEVHELLAGLRLEPHEVDLILDVGAITSEFRVPLAFLRGALQRLPHAGSWRSVAVAGGSFPSSLAAYPRDELTRLPRWEWAMYLALRGEIGQLGWVPDYADYGIAHPDPPEARDPKTMRTSANLRYSYDSTWLIAKGRTIREAGNTQARGLAQKIIDSGNWAGPTFSWGDVWLTECARGLDGPGNQTTWRTVGTSHHLAMVTAQLADRDGA